MTESDREFSGRSIPTQHIVVPWSKQFLVTTTWHTHLKMALLTAKLSSGFPFNNRLTVNGNPKLEKYRWFHYNWHMLIKMGRLKRICVFGHSVMTNFNCACSAIQRGQGSGFLSEGSSWLTACMSEQRRFWRDCADAQARLNLRCSHKR